MDNFFRNVFEKASIGIAVINASTDEFLQVNEEFCGFTGYDEQELLARTWIDITYNDDIDVAKQLLFRLHNCDLAKISMDKRYIHKKGNIISARMNCTMLDTVQDEDCLQRYILVLFGESAELARNHFNFLGQYDVLTGLHSRNYFELEQSKFNISLQLPLVVAMIDVNNLKLINDVFGHSAGDKVLQAAARAVKRSCNAGDIAVRYGGDEIVVLMPDSGEQNAIRMVDEIKSNMSKEVVEGIPLSAAIGYAIKKDSSESIKLILGQADDIMYQNKLSNAENVLKKTIEALMNVLYDRDSDIKLHIERVSDLCCKLGELLGIDEATMKDLEYFSRVHDIGKIVLPDSMLKKEAALTPAEWRKLEHHPEVGYRIMSAVRGLSSNIVEAILCYQEHWDGCGYPKKLKGMAIPWMSRVLAIVEAFDAMTNDRPYRKAMSVECALREIKSCAGTQFDPYLADRFVDLMRRG